MTTDGLICTVAGTGVSGSSGDGGQATMAQLYYPRHIFVDTSFVLFIADYGISRIRKVAYGCVNVPRCVNVVAMYMVSCVLQL